MAADAEPMSEAPAAEELSLPEAASATAAPAVAVAVQDFKIFSATTEAINGRAAMLGFAVALAAEASTGA